MFFCSFTIVSISRRLCTFQKHFYISFTSHQLSLSAKSSNKLNKRFHATENAWHSKWSYEMNCFHAPLSTSQPLTSSSRIVNCCPVWSLTLSFNSVLWISSVQGRFLISAPLLEFRRIWCTFVIAFSSCRRQLHDLPWLAAIKDYDFPATTQSVQLHLTQRQCRSRDNSSTFSHHPFSRMAVRGRGTPVKGVHTHTHVSYWHRCQGASDRKKTVKSLQNIQHKGSCSLTSMSATAWHFLNTRNWLERLQLKSGHRSRAPGAKGRRTKRFPLGDAYCREKVRVNQRAHR